MIMFVDMGVVFSFKSFSIGYVINVIKLDYEFNMLNIFGPMTTL